MIRITSLRILCVCVALNVLGPPEGDAGLARAEQSCTFTVRPAPVYVVAAATSSQVSVDTSPSCSWKAASNVSWLRITDGETGTGDGIVKFTVDAFAGQERDGTLILEGTTVAVTVIQARPSISNVPNRSILEDASTGPLAFTVSTVATPLSSLTVTATSSNPTLVPSSAIVLGGAGENRTITITPPLNRFGDATITLTADDGSATSSDTFVLTVTNVNDPPTISPVAAQIGAAGRLVGPLAVIVADSDSDVAALTLTASSGNPEVVPPAGLSVQLASGSGGASRILFAQTANVTGISIITLTASDGALASTLFFPIESTHFAPLSLTADPDGSLVNLAWSDPVAGGATANYRLEFIPTPPLAGRSTIAVDVAGSTFVATNLAVGSWIARVRALTPTSLGPPSNDATFTLTGAPSRPLNFDVAVSGNALTFTWDAPAAGAVSGYVLEAGTVASASNLVVMPVGLTQSFPAAAPNGTYFTRIRAVNTAGTSSPSNELSFSTGLTTPGAPRSLRVSVSGTSAVIAWDAPAGGGASGGYILEAGSASGLSNIATVPVPSTSFSVPSVPNGTYFVRVRAISGGGAGPASLDTAFTVGGGPVLPPGAPTNLTSSVSGATVMLAWSPPTAGGTPTSYTVEAGSGPGLSNLATVAVGATPSFSTSGVPPGTYFVRVVSTNAAGASAPSNEVTIVVP